MNNKVIIVKVSDRSNDGQSLKKACKDICKYVEMSYENFINKFLKQKEAELTLYYYVPLLDNVNKNLYFLTNNKDYEIISNNGIDNIEEIKEKINRIKENDCIYRLKNNTSALFFVINYHDNNKKTLYVGEAPIKIIKGKSQIMIFYQIFLRFESNNAGLMIKNFEKLQFLDEKDFDGAMICCENVELVKQFRYIIENIKQKSLIDYSKFIKDDNDKSVENSLLYTSPCNSNDEVYKNTLKQEDTFCSRFHSQTKKNNKLNRTNFQRDYERIIHAKAFRRLVDKAQIFTSSKGDHYRTRMIHTMEVSQIARGIAKELDLNVELTEAIALAHDIGHTPFGHQGERTLNDILRGKIDGIFSTKQEYSFGGFKHNLQGVKVVTQLEKKYFEHDGINLSYQVVEGILKHTKFLACKDCSSKHDCKGKNGECEKIENEVKEFLSDNFKTDELFLKYSFSTTLEGQVVAIADEIAQRSHDIDDALRSYLITFNDLKNYLSFEKFSELKQLIIKVEEKYLKNEEKIIYNTGIDILHGRIISEIIAFFVRKVVDNSKKNIKEYEEDINDTFFNDYQRINKELITFDIVTFNLCNYLEEIISKKVITCNEVACFDNKGKMIVQKLFKAYYEKPLLLPQSFLLRIYKETLKQYDTTINMVVSDTSVVNKEIQMILKYYELDKEKQQEYFDKQKILVRAIVDYIAGMTDSYAVNEYKRIYEV